MIKLGIYQHSKTKNFYQVIGVARHEETHESVVIYQCMYGDFGLWARAQDVFEASIELDGKEVPRFKFISENLVNMPKLS